MTGIKIKKIGIAGVGMVGEQILGWFKAKKIPVVGFDKYKNIGKESDLYDSDVIFLCLPTPHNKKEPMGVDLSIFKNFIKNFRVGVIFIIKSTVPVGTTELLQKEFPKYYFLHNPEFLTESTAWKDFSKPIFQLVGYTEKSKDLAKTILKILPKAKHAKIVSSNTTELLKFARNSFFAIKVAFANQIFDLSEKTNVNYSDIKEIMELDPWIGGNHLNVMHKDYRGFGGKCLPKDLRTLIKTFNFFGIQENIFSSVDEYNTKLLKSQNLEETLNKYWLGNYNEPKI